jgi:CRISPR-associated endonuclease Cas1
MISRTEFVEKQIVFVFPAKGDTISFLNDNLVVKDAKGKTKLQSTCYLILSVFIVGYSSITGGLMARAKKFGFSIVFMSQNLKVYSVLNGGVEGNTLLRRKQYEYSGFEIAGRLVSNKIDNQIRLLKGIRKKDDSMRSVITQLEDYSAQVRNSVFSCQELMGREGCSSKLYFPEVFKEANWVSRRPRVKFDTVNCLLDIGYTLLFNYCEAILSLFGFDLYVGVLHREFYNRKSLVCDIIEPFRPIIDRAIRKAYNLGQVKEDDFYVDQHQYFLFGKKAVPYIGLLMNAIFEYKEEMFCFVQSYYRAFIRSLPVEQFPYFELK